MATADTEVIKTCKLPMILDGKFFKIVKEDNIGDKVKAKCVDCGQIISGQLNATTNFKTHLQVLLFLDAVHSRSDRKRDR
jgi:hypothetical protein